MSRSDILFGLGAGIAVLACLLANSGRPSVAPPGQTTGRLYRLEVPIAEDPADGPRRRIVWVTDGGRTLYAQLSDGALLVVKAHKHPLQVDIQPPPPVDDGVPDWADEDDRPLAPRSE